MLGTAGARRTGRCRRRTRPRARCGGLGSEQASPRSEGMRRATRLTVVREVLEHATREMTMGCGCQSQLWLETRCVCSTTNRTVRQLDVTAASAKKGAPMGAIFRVKAPGVEPFRPVPRNHQRWRGVAPQSAGIKRVRPSRFVRFGRCGSAVSSGVRVPTALPSLAN